jgi:hypothetical protein
MQRTKFVFYVYDEDAPYYGFWMLKDPGNLSGEYERGMSLFERTGEQAMWLSPEIEDRQFEAREPTDEFETILQELADGEKVHSDRIQELPDYEGHFIDGFIGTRKGKPDAIPDAVYAYANGNLGGDG